MRRIFPPSSNELTDGFWAAAREQRLVIQQCVECQQLRHYPQPMCPLCHCSDWAWAQVPGTGVVHSFTETHQPFHPAWRDRVPYVVATIALDCGVRMISDLDESVDRVYIGVPVEVFFEDIGDDITIPRFRLTTEKRNQ